MMGDPALDALWKNVLDRWDEDKAHAAFLDYCQRSDQLAEAATRYRGMTGDRDRGPSAQKRLGAITALALARLEASRSAAPPPRGRALGVLLVVFFVFGTAGLLFYLYSGR